MTDPPRSARLGGCEGPAWRGLFAEPGTSVENQKKKEKNQRASPRNPYACFGFNGYTFHKQVA